jgi:gamma-glutamyltranspeptidase / glutathione hydrolase
MKKLLIALCLFLLPTLAFAKGGAVSAADPRATEAGQEMLRQGGSATDAALAMMLALTVVEPQSSGIGGGGFFVHHDGKTGQIATIDGRETAPSGAKATQFLGSDGQPMPFSQAVPGGRSVGIPGNVSLMARAHARWGKLKWAQLFQPAIRLADQGFAVTPRLARSLAPMGPLWADFPAARGIYFNGDGPKQVGEIVRNPELAILLRTLSKRGAKAFYTGANAQSIMATTAGSKRNPTVLRASDFSRYRAKDRDALCMPYRQYQLCGMGPPSSGATTVFQILGMLERFDLRALGKDSPQAWHAIAEAMQLAYADREKYLADPDFVLVPSKGLLDPAYVKSRSALISLSASLPTYVAGVPPGAPARTVALSGEVSGTSHFVAADGRGDVVSMTSTIESPFGSQLVVNGYFLNNELTDFTFAPELNGEPVANRVQPGKRPLSSMAPTIVYGPDGKPVFAVGAAGGKTIIMQVAKTLIAHLDWGLTAQDAIAAPNIFFTTGTVMLEANTPLSALSSDIAKLGQTVLSADMPRLKANAIELTPSGWKGAADPRSEGVALEE